MVPNPYKEGTMSHRLFNEVQGQAPIQPRPKASEAPADAPAAKRLLINKVRATFAGTSKLQAGSTRAAVLKFVQDAPDYAATVQRLEEHFQTPVRGYLQKLIEKGHLVVVTEG